MNTISTLIFDLGGVIINLKTEKDWLEEDLLPHFNPEKLNDLLQHNFFQDFETGKIEVPVFIQQLKDIALNKLIAEEEIIHHWNGILKEIPAYRVDMLKKLSEKYRLVLLSNTNHIHMDFIRKYMQQSFGEDFLEGIFNTCYYSQEIGLRKPHKEIYEYVVRQENLPAEQCIFFDDKQENLTEAGNLGIHTMLVDKEILDGSLLNFL